MKFLHVAIYILSTLELSGFVLDSQFIDRQLRQKHLTAKKRKSKKSKQKSKKTKINPFAGRRKLLRFFDMDDDNSDRGRGLLGSSGKNGSIETKDGLKINFPPLPKCAKSPITINTPASAYPTVVTDAKQQKPIVLVHEILEPRIKKRVFVHHNTPFLDQYSKMAYSMNPYYMQMAQQNPYYSQFAKESPGYQGMVNSPEFSQPFQAANKYFKAGR